MYVCIHIFVYISNLLPEAKQLFISVSRTLTTEYEMVGWLVGRMVDFYGISAPVIC